MSINKQTVNVSGGIGFFGLLTLLLVALKLTNFISWSWWLVLLPLYLPFVVLFFILIFMILFVR